MPLDDPLRPLRNLRAPVVSGAATDDPAAEFLHSRINYERADVVPYSQRDFRLDRMRHLLDRLGNPHRDLPIVHIAGTKGKGSVAVMVAEVLRRSNYRTGMFSSPHLDRVEERIAVDGEPCTAEELARLVEHVRPMVAAMDELPADEPGTSHRPTYFEIVTALALLHFAQRRVDAAVLEVGLGGRLDSTNVCQPLVSVITSISFDHTQQLGETLAEIAGEKAGIIKPSVPVVCGVRPHDPQQVIMNVAAENGCSIVQLGREFDYRYDPPRRLERAAACGRLDYIGNVGGKRREFNDIALSLPGEHQAANAAVAIATIEQLEQQGWSIPQSAVRSALAEVRWPARVEVVRRNPTIVLDAAHNVASIDALVRVLDESFSPGPRVLIFATTRDKDVRGMLRILLPAFEEVIVTRYWQNPRGVAPEVLAAAAAEISPQAVHLAADPATAWELAKRIASPDHLICVAGSFFIVSEMRSAIESLDS